MNAGISTAENIQEGASAEEFVADVVDVGIDLLRTIISSAVAGAATGLVADIWDKACEWGSDLLCSTIG